MDWCASPLGSTYDRQSLDLIKFQVPGGTVFPTWATMAFWIPCIARLSHAAATNMRGWDDGKGAVWNMAGLAVNELDGWLRQG